MVEGMVGLVQVPQELAGEVVSFLSSRYPNRETEKRGVKPVTFAANALGEIAVKGLPAPDREVAKVLVEGILLGMSGQGFAVTPTDADEDSAIEMEI